MSLVPVLSMYIFSKSSATHSFCFFETRRDVVTKPRARRTSGCSAPACVVRRIRTRTRRDPSRLAPPFSFSARSPPRLAAAPRTPPARRRSIRDDVASGRTRGLRRDARRRFRRVRHPAVPFVARSIRKSLGPGTGPTARPSRLRPTRTRSPRSRGGRIRADRIRRFLGKRTLLPAAPSPRLWRLRANPRRETKEKGLKKPGAGARMTFDERALLPRRRTERVRFGRERARPLRERARAPHRRRPTIGRTPRGARTRRPPRRATCRGRWTRRMTRGARKPSARTRGGARGPWRAPPRCARPGTARWSGSTCHAGGTLRTSPRGRARERTEASPRTRR